jgi:hypothetical protein
VNPPTEPQFLEEYAEAEVPHPDKPGTTLVIKLPVKKPKMCKMKRQHHVTGDVQDIEVQEHKDLYPRTFIVGLTVGNEYVQRDLCKECFLKFVKPEAKALWDNLAGLGSKSAPKIEAIK